MSSQNAPRSYALVVAGVTVVLLLGGIIAALKLKSGSRQRQALPAGGTVELLAVQHGKQIRFDPNPWYVRLRKYVPFGLSSRLPVFAPLTEVQFDKPGNVLAPVLLFRSASPFFHENFEFSDGQGWTFIESSGNMPIFPGLSSPPECVTPIIPFFPHTSEWLDLKLFNWDGIAPDKPIAAFRFRNPVYRSRAADSTSPTISLVRNGDLEFRIDKLESAPRSGFTHSGTWMRETRARFSVLRNGMPTDQWLANSLQISDRYGSHYDSSRDPDMISFSSGPFDTLQQESSGNGNSPAKERENKFVMGDIGLYAGEGPFQVVAGFEKTHGFQKSELWTITAKLPGTGTMHGDAVTTTISGGTITFSGIRVGTGGLSFNTTFPDYAVMPFPVPQGLADTFSRQYSPGSMQEPTHSFELESSRLSEDIRVRLYDLRDGDGNKINYMTDPKLPSDPAGPTKESAGFGFSVFAPSGNHGSTILVTLAITRLHIIEFVTEPTIVPNNEMLD